MKKFCTFLLAVFIVGLNVFSQDPENPEKFKKPVFISESGNEIPGDILSSEDIILQEDILDELSLPDRTHDLKARPLAGEGSLDGDNSYVSDEDSLALVAFYYSTNGDSWFDNTNWLTGPVNSWYGVEVSTGRITQISMESNNLTGSLPPDIGELTDLTFLSLAHNAIGGVIPVELSSLYNLYDLTLWENQLTGSIPAGLGSLTNLMNLDLSTNQLTGSIPAELGNLSSLYYLWLSDNQLSGSIPPELGNLVNLTYLWMGQNQLSGSIPPELGNLSKLYEFILYHNQLSGSIPPELGNLTEAYYFVLSDNLLSGTIPEELGNLVGAAGVWLWLHNNQLTDVIPSSLGNVSKMYSLSLYSNQLSGTIPPELGNLSTLDDLLLSDNQLTGSIPPELGNLVSLGRLKLSGNQLSGSVPLELGYLSSMGTLDLYDNQLTDLPDLSTLTSLTRLLIHNNHFDFEDFQHTGLDFTSLSDLSYAPQLNLDAPTETVSGSDIILTCATSGSGDTYQWFKDGEMIGGETSGSLTISNSVTGVFKCEVFNSSYSELILTTEPYFSNLENSHGIVKDEYDALVALYNSTVGAGWFDNSNWLTEKDAGQWFGIAVENGHVIRIELDENNLTGYLSSDIGDFPLLEALDLGLNDISGTIPGEIFNLVNLTEITLWDNQFTGTIPDGIENLTKLEVLDFDTNQLTGSIPAGIGSLSNLQYIYMSANQLSGSIPSSFGNLGNLRLLYMFENQLSGLIPAELGNLDFLERVALSSNQLSGSLPPELGNLSNLNYLSLSRNQLSGAIPAELGNLSSLQYLYLYGNQLNGSIPPELGNLPNLQNLYLYENQLSGSIPPELGNLVYLRALNIRDNQLSGDLPPEINNLVNLNYFYVNNNQFTSLPDLSSLVNLYAFWVRDNYLEFDDLQNTGLDFAYIPEVVYGPQFELDAPSETVSGDDIILTCTTFGLGDTYQWFKDEQLINGETSGSLTISNSAVGVYYCEVYNSGFPELVLSSKPYFSNISYSHGILEEEYDALVALYNSTIGTGWTNNTNWLSEEDADQWYGVVTEKGHVSSINLAGINLAGTLPSEIGDFPMLEMLDLQTNSISGTIPDELYNLSSLRELWLRENSLEGAISPNIQNLSSLEVLQIRTNYLSGTIPEEMGTLTNLSGINLSQTALEGAVPASFNNLANLQYLYLYETNLSQLPTLSSMYSLDNFYTNISRFTFEDFISTGLNFNLLGNVAYAPQADLELITTGLEISQGEDLTLNCQALTVEDLWSPNNEFAVYKGMDLVYNWSFDPEFVISSIGSGDAGDYTIRVRNSTYPDLILYSDTLQVSVLANQVPTDISLSPDNIDEDQPSGTEVGTFSTTDADVGDTHTYSFATGDAINDADNSDFVIEGAALKTATDLNYETKNSYSIFVRSTDEAGATFDKAFTVTVNDVAETGLEDAESFHAEVYPNPSTGKFLIRTSKQALRIEVYNNSGQKVVDRMVDSEQIELDLTGYSSGIYYLKIKIEKRTYQTRLVKL